MIMSNNISSISCSLYYIKFLLLFCFSFTEKGEEEKEEKEEDLMRTYFLLLFSFLKKKRKKKKWMQ